MQWDDFLSLNQWSPNIQIIFDIILQIYGSSYWRCIHGLLKVVMVPTRIKKDDQKYIDQSKETNNYQLEHVVHDL